MPVCLSLSFKMIRSHSGPGPGPGSGPAFCRSFLLLIIVFRIFWSSAFAACYYPNGRDKNLRFSREVYQPCDSGDEHSMCCALNRAYPDRCRSDGLCFSVVDLNVWRDSCTDPTWKSSSCVQLCNSGIGIQIFSSDP